MPYSLKQLDGFTLVAPDGEIGHVKEAYFDDQHWTIRHLVVHTGGWLTGRHVLISPQAFRGIDPAHRRIAVALERQRIETAPDIDTARPVSRQHETALHDHYGLPYWWSGGSQWSAAPYSLAETMLTPDMARAPGGVDVEQAQGSVQDPHLRSSAEVIGNHVEARDGGIGHIDDLLFDEQSWAIRFAVVDTGDWLPGRRVLVEPRWIERIDWAAHRVGVGLTRGAVESSPPYEPDAPQHEDHFRRVQRHFERSE